MLVVVVLYTFNTDNFHFFTTQKHAGLIGARGATMKYRVLVEVDEDGVFVAEVPSLPGCVSQGASQDEALTNVREAISLYIESLEERGEPVPPPIN